MPVLSLTLTYVSNNVELDEIQRLVKKSGMRHVDRVRHFRITINSKGQVPIKFNIVPIERKMAQISDRISLLHNTPISQSILPHLGPADQLIINSASADQLGPLRWHYNH